MSLGDSPSNPFDQDWLSRREREGWRVMGEKDERKDGYLSNMSQQDSLSCNGRAGQLLVTFCGFLTLLEILETVA